MGADVDQEQHFRAGFWMLLLRENNPAIITGGTRVKSGQLPAQVLRFQAGIVEIIRQSPQGRLNL